MAERCLKKQNMKDKHGLLSDEVINRPEDELSSKVIQKITPTFPTGGEKKEICVSLQGQK